MYTYIDYLQQLNCFDDEEQLLRVVSAVNRQIRQGAIRVGLFGSRANGSYRRYQSDIDILVLDPKAPACGDYVWDGEVNIVRIPSEIKPIDDNSRVLNAMYNSTLWFWGES